MSAKFAMSIMFSKVRSKNLLREVRGVTFVSVNIETVLP